MIQRRLAWSLSKDDTQVHEVFHIFFKHTYIFFFTLNMLDFYDNPVRFRFCYLHFKMKKLSLGGVK